MSLKIVDTGKSAPADNMQKDADLLESLGEHSECILHLYEWQGPSATYGYFTKPSEHLCRDGMQKHGLQLARRPTGGGIIFHQYDYAFSILVPAAHKCYSMNTLENYAVVNQVLVECISEFLQLNTNPTLLVKENNCSPKECFQFCMAKPTVFDVMIEGRKIAGGAQRKTKKGFLHQGSISLVLPPKQFLEEVLLNRSQVGEAMKQTTYPLLDADGDVEGARKKLKEALVNKFSERF